MQKLYVLYPSAQHSGKLFVIIGFLLKNSEK